MIGFVPRAGAGMAPADGQKMNWNPEQHYQDTSVAGDYDAVRFSSLAGRVFNALEQRTVARCFRNVPVGGTLVDVPCGTGRLAGPLLALGYNVHGMDISAEMLDVAARRLQAYGAKFTREVADARHVADGARQFDAALCARVLMHFPLEQQIEFLAGVARLSRSVVVINHSLDSAYQRFRRRIKRALGHQPSANHPISNADIKRLLAGAGLREVRRYRLSRLISEAVYIVAEKA